MNEMELGGDISVMANSKRIFDVSFCLYFICFKTTYLVHETGEMRKMILFCFILLCCKAVLFHQR